MAITEQSVVLAVASSPTSSRRWASSRQQHRLVWIVAESPLRLGTQQNIQMLKQILNQSEKS